VPIIEPLRPVLTRRLEVVGHDPMARLLTGPRGGRVSTAVLRDATHWDPVVTALGYEHLRRHSLRHTALTWMADAGIPFHVLKEIAGHGQITTTQRYLHPDLRHLKQADASLTAFLLPPRW
jgi:integrase